MNGKTTALLINFFTKGFHKEPKNKKKKKQAIGCKYIKWIFLRDQKAGVNLTLNQKEHFLHTHIYKPPFI